LHPWFILELESHLLRPHQVKESLLKSGLVGDNIYCHILSGLGAGFFAVICGSPVDVVKSRLMGAISD
jgi:solute carrier family 25 uncoupling protein 8/9